MSKRPLLRVKAVLALVGTGALALNIGGCTTQDIKTQLANGFNSTVLNILGIGTRALADEVFDVDD